MDNQTRSCLITFNIIDFITKTCIVFVLFSVLLSTQSDFESIHCDSLDKSMLNNETLYIFANDSIALDTYTHNLTTTNFTFSTDYHQYVKYINNSISNICIDIDYLDDYGYNSSSLPNVSTIDINSKMHKSNLHIILDKFSGRSSGSRSSGSRSSGSHSGGAHPPAHVNPISSNHYLLLLLMMHGHTYNPSEHYNICIKTDFQINIKLLATVFCTQLYANENYSFVLFIVMIVLALFSLASLLLMVYYMRYNKYTDIDSTTNTDNSYSESEYGYTFGFMDIVRHNIIRLIILQAIIDIILILTLCIQYLIPSNDSGVIDLYKTYYEYSY